MRSCASCGRWKTAHPELQTPDSPTQRVGGQPREGFVKVRAQFADAEFGQRAERRWNCGSSISRVRALLKSEPYEYVAELKLDGLSMAAQYEHGQLQQAFTRGDGRVGEDVTDNARTIRSLPLHAAQSRSANAFEVRGEVVMQRRLLRAPERRTGESGLASALPILAMRPPGALAGLDPGVTAARRLDYFAYFLLEDGKPMFDEPLGSLSNSLAAAGLQSELAPPQMQRPGRTARASSANGKPSAIRSPYEIDGVVAKIDSIRSRSVSAGPPKRRVGPSLSNIRRVRQPRFSKISRCKWAAPAR